MRRGGYHDVAVDTVKRRGLEPESALDAIALARGAFFAWSSPYRERLSAGADDLRNRHLGDREGERDDFEAKRPPRPAK